MKNKIYIFNESTEGSIVAFLNDATTLENVPEEYSTNIWPYISRSNAAKSKINSQFEIIDKTPRTTKSHKLYSPEIVSQIGISLTAACIYGAAQFLVKLLWEWTKNNSGRIRIANGKEDVVLDNNATKEDINTATKMLEQEFDIADNDTEL